MRRCAKMLQFEVLLLIYWILRTQKSNMNRANPNAPAGI